MKFLGSTMSNNNEYTFDELYREYYLWLRDCLQNLTNDNELIKDLLQQTFFTVYCVYFISRKNCIFDSPKRILYKISISYYEIQIQKNNSIIEAQNTYSLGNFPLNMEISMEFLSLVHECLTDDMKTYFILNFYYGFSYSDIAKLTKTSMSAISITISNAVEILRKEAES